MVQFDESRRRTFIIVAATVFIGASLGYMYSYSRSNRLLTNKHDALKYNYRTCAENFDKCSSKLSECEATSEQIKQSEQQLKNDLEEMTVKFGDSKRALENAQGTLATLHKFFFDVGVLTGLFDPADTNTDQEITSDRVTNIMEKLEALKQGKTDYEGITAKYATLQENFNKLSGEKKEVDEKLQVEHGAKSLVQAQLDDMKEKLSALQSAAQNTPKPKTVEAPKEAPKTEVAELPKEAPKTETIESTSDAATKGDTTASPSEQPVLEQNVQPTQ